MNELYPQYVRWFIEICVDDVPLVGGNKVWGVKHTKLTTETDKSTDRVPKFSRVGMYVKQCVRDKLIEHRQYITTYGEDMPEIDNWKWPGS